MDFLALGQKLLSLGLPVLGNALFGPLGGAAAQVIANAIGAPAATPEAINSTLTNTDNEVAIQKLKSAEAEWIATIQSQTEIGRTQLQTVADTMKAEITAAAAMQESRTGRIIAFMQLSWRPIWTYQTIAEFVAMDVIALHELWTGDMATVNAMMGFSGFLIWYFGMKVAVVGIYSVGRSAEKIAGAEDSTNAAPSWVKTILNAIAKKR